MSSSASPFGKLMRRLSGWWLLAILTVLGLSAIVTGAMLAKVTHDKWFDALWLEIAKAGIQVVAIGVLGGALAFIWGNFTTRRDRDIQRRDNRRERAIERRDKERERAIERRDK